MAHTPSLAVTNAAAAGDTDAVLAAARETLQAVFGYTDFRAPQDEIIAALLGGKDVFALMPTGGGKSLCYQLPALLREGTGVVVSPLIALMQDQVAALGQWGVDAAFLNSSQSFEEQIQVADAFRSGQLDMLYVAPERLVAPRTIEMLQAAPVSLFAIDEAHCVSQWGHDFRPEYRQLSLLAEQFPGVPRIALTATADQKTRQEIINELHLERAESFVASFDRPNIRYTITDGPDAKGRLLTFIEREHSGDAGVVYCLSRKKTESVADWLTSKGRPAIAYHAGMDARERQRRLERFLREDGLIVVATIAFGMGIDKPDVRFVAHLDLPKSVEAYYQETGRAGRDGLPSNAWMSYTARDIMSHRGRIDDSEASDTHKQVSHTKLDALVAMTEGVGCRRRALLAYFDEQRDTDCGNCDNCLNPPATIDVTEDARKALSTVYRTGQRYGMGYMLEVLLGIETDRIKGNGHDLLSTYGIGKDRTTDHWRAVFKQLIAEGHLAPSADMYNVLHMTDQCRALLRGEATLSMRKVRPQPAGERRGRGSRRESPNGRGAIERQLGEREAQLFQRLKDVRRQLADEGNVPPYVVCHDRSLLELVEQKPDKIDELYGITGLGEAKISRYGSALLEALAGAD